MTFTLTPDIEAAVTEQARRLSLSPEALVLSSLRTMFVTKAICQPIALIEPRDDWERRLASIGTHTGVSLTDEQVSSKGIYQESLVEEAMLEKSALALEDTQGYDLTPRDEWERRILGVGVHAGVSLTDEQLGREIMYEDHD